MFSILNCLLDYSEKIPFVKAAPIEREAKATDAANK
jgi:hypothetical protein